MGARDANPVDFLLVRALVVGHSFAWLVEVTCLGSQNRDAEILAYFDVVRILEGGIELMNLLQEFRSAGSELFRTNAQQGLPSFHPDCACRAG